MKNKIVILITLVIIILYMISVPVLAASYKYTGTGFKYFGDFFHEKEFKFYGGAGAFEVLGRGFVRGSHDVHTSAAGYVYNEITGRYDRSEKKVNVDLNFYGITDASYGINAARLERDLLANIESRRIQAIAALNQKYKNSPDMSADSYYDEMMDINRYFDEMRASVIASYSIAKENVRIISTLNLSSTSPTASTNIGVAMDPGQSGYIRESVAAISNSDGSHLRIDSQYGNTGGTTRREMEVKGFMSESLRVEGYAEVWESTEVRSGTARTGFWNAMP